MKSDFKKNQITRDSVYVAIETQETLMVHHFFNKIEKELRAKKNTSPSEKNTMEIKEK